MNTEVEKFDPSTIKDKIREKIQKEAFDLIPQGAWDQMVEKELSGFFREDIPKRGGGYNSEHGPKTLREMIRDVLGEKLLATVKVELQKEQYQGQSLFTDGVEEFLPGDFIKQQIKDNLEEILKLVVTSLMGRTMQGVIFEMTQKLQNQGM